MSNFREPLSLENTLWCNTLLTSGSILGVVISIGRETKIAMNSSMPRTKLGYLDSYVIILFR